MIGFSSTKNETNVLLDLYNTVNDKKNDTIATVIANRRSNKDRVSATAIGAGFGVAQSVLFAGTYAGAKVFPNLQKFFPVKWAVDKVEKWIKIAQINNPNASKLNNVLTGVLSKSLWLIGSCAVTGFLFDLYNNIMDTKLNGKFSNVKQGVQKDSWLISGLKSLSGTDEGKKIIRNSMRASDDGVVIKFKGVNREYIITKKEIKKASREYLTLFDNAGKVKGYRKNYSSGDGDVLAFELAFKKYQQDLKEGKIKANPNLPKCANQFSSEGNLSDTDVTQFYYFLSGEMPSEINNKFFNMNERAKLEDFIQTFSDDRTNKSAVFKFKDTQDGKLSLKTRWLNHQIVSNKESFDTDKVYTIKKIGKNFVTFVDPRNTAVDIHLPLEEFKKRFDKIYFMKLDKFA